MTLRLTFLFIISFLAMISARDLFAQESDEDPELTYEIEGESPHQLMDPESLETTRAYRRADLPVRNFNDARWKEIVGDEDYNEKPVVKPDFDGPSIAWAGPIVKIIAYGLVIALVSAAIWYILKNISFTAKVERDIIQNESFEENVENIELLDIEALLEKARREGNFRTAVRLYYLGLLKKLNSQGIISWKKDKTNRDYLAELFSRGFYFADIQNLTMSYEEVWYGDHTLKEDAFERLRESFENVYQKIQTVKTS